MIAWWVPLWLLVLGHLAGGDLAQAQQADSSTSTVTVGEAPLPPSEVPPVVEGSSDNLQGGSDASSGKSGEPPQGFDSEKVIAEVLKEMPPEVAEEARRAREKFQKTQSILADEMLALRRLQIRYINGVDQNPAAKEAFRLQRSKVSELLRQHFDEALDLIRFLPSAEAGSYLVTMVQHQIGQDEYTPATFEASTRMIDLGQQFVYLFLAAARSGVVAGRFDDVRKIYEFIDPEQLKETDQRLLANLEQLERNFQREQRLLQNVDFDSLPRVRFVTTKGDFVTELFSDSAPSAVAHFLRLVEDGFYDGLDFSQVSDGLLALTGDPAGDGRGNAGQFLVDEHTNENAHTAQRGSLIMAKIPTGPGEFIPNSASSQIAIPFLPIATASDQQTIIGRVIENMHVVSSLRRVDPTKKKSEKEVEVPPDAILTVEVIRRGPDLPEPNYVDLEAEFRKAAEAGAMQRVNE